MIVVEACALRVEQLILAAAIGVPDVEAGEVITLFVTARPGTEVTPEGVLAACRKHLPKFMVPRSVMIIEAMPLNPTRKNDSAHAESLPSVG